MGNRKQISIGIIGGGASGMMAAITASKQGAKVTLLEGGDRVGRKILSTGNGKCNLGNENLSVEEYNGADPSWIQACLAEFDVQAAKAFFAEAGLLLKDKNGYLYPYAEQAAVVLDVLRRELARAGVEVVTGCKAREIVADTGGQQDENAGFTVRTENRQLHFDRVILACGGQAAPKTGSDGSGYELARRLGHNIVPVVPALVQLRCREPFLKEVAGVRAEAELLAEHGGERIQERGELQLTDYGISGIPVFQLSRKVNYILKNMGKSAEVEVRIDFLPEYASEEIQEMFGQRAKRPGGQTVEELFTGILNKKLMQLFIKMAGLKRDMKAADADERKLRQVLQLCKDFRVHVTGSNSFDQAQICAGGVDTAQVQTTMESKLIPGLYFAGELLDVDGRCGGYNLHWAWCSGYLAGKNAGSASLQGSNEIALSNVADVVFAIMR